MWDLLGDVGGFHDGLFLLCSFFVTAYASMSFQRDLLHGTMMEDPRDKKIQKFQRSASFRKML